MILKSSSNYLSIPGNTRAQMYKLGIPYGGMKVWLKDIRTGFTTTYHILWLEENNTVLAWCILKKSWGSIFANKETTDFAVYTRKSYRRFGLAEKLYNAAVVIEPQFYTYPHDPKSLAFFKKQKSIIC